MIQSSVQLAELEDAGDDHTSPVQLFISKSQTLTYITDITFHRQGVIN